MARSTPIQRALAELHALGYLHARVCWYSRKLRRRVRPLGFADVLAVKAGCPILAVLVSPAAWGRGQAERRLLAGLPEALAWTAAGGALEVWGWAKRARRWHLVRLPVQPPAGNPATTFDPPPATA